MDQATGPKPRYHMFGFLDETGLLHTSDADQIFALGLISVQNPRELHRSIINYKNKYNFRSEFKFSSITQKNVKLYKGFIDLFFAHSQIRFHAAVYDKKKMNINDSYRSYNNCCGNLVAAALQKNSSKVSEYITILADDVSTPKSDKYEIDVRDKIKSKLRRNALFGICRVESHAVSEIQLCDVMLGVVAYSYKLRLGLVPKPKKAKLELIKHIQTHLNIPLLSDNVDRKLKRSIRFQVFEHM